MDEIDEDMLIRRFHTRFKAVRDRRSLSQEKLAQVLGFHHSYIGRLERGEENPTLRTIARLAIGLDIHPFDLLGIPVPTDAATLRAAASGDDPGRDDDGDSEPPVDGASRQ